MADGLGRRDAIRLLAMSALLPTAAAASAPVPQLSLVFSAKVLLGTPVELGAENGSRRRFVPITGGEVNGPDLLGQIVPGGGDWQSIGPDGVTEIHARYLIQARDGAMISIDNPGIRVASPAIIARLTAGEEVDPSLYYFRTAPSFDVSTPTYAWMRRSLFVASGARHPDHVLLTVYRLS